MTLFDVSSKIYSPDRHPIECLWTFQQNAGNELPPREVLLEITNSVSVKKENYGIFNILTFKPNPPRNKPDDVVYEKYPDLQKLLPRAMSLVFESSNLVGVLSGPLKFSGVTSGDEDDQETTPSNEDTIYDPSLTKSWVRSGDCEIVYTEKANGKFVIMTILTHGDRFLIIFGSKNCHYACYLDDLHQFVEEEESLTEIVQSLGRDIFTNLESLLKLSSKFEEGFSLVGELEDGLHFVPGDNTVTWFGLFKNGIPLDPVSTLNLLSECGIKTVHHELVFSPGDTLEDLERVLNMSKCTRGEGAVLYIRNPKNGKSQMAKSKSAVYILKRILRQQIINLQMNIHDKIIKRIVETKDYHCLNTPAVIKATHLLFRFVEWLLVEKGYPTNVLNFKPIKSVRGVIDNIGFARYWQMFLDETRVEDLVFSPDDFDGSFDELAYYTAPELQVFPELPVKRIEHTPSVIFIQDIQGGGKSSIALKLSGFVVVEQDVCYGDTNTCQFQLMYHTRHGRNIIVSRCNANNKQFYKYLSIALSAHCKVVFVASENVKTELRLAIALAGIITRSRDGDKVLVGRMEHPFQEVVEFTTKNWSSFQYHPQVIKIPTFRFDDEMNEAAKKAVESGDLQHFVTENHEALMHLRVPLDELVASVQDIFINPPVEALVPKSLRDTIYVGLYVLESDRVILRQRVKEVCDVEGKVYCEHLTQAFLGRKKSKPNIKLVPPGQICTVVINALVVNNEKGSAAFRVNSVFDDASGEIVAIKMPHITALVASGCKPSESRLFAFSEDDSVTIYRMDITISTICRYI